jgi:hypothetical protein
METKVVLKEIAKSSIGGLFIELEMHNFEILFGMISSYVLKKSCEDYFEEGL